MPESAKFDSIGLFNQLILACRSDRCTTGSDNSRKEVLCIRTAELS